MKFSSKPSSTVEPSAPHPRRRVLLLLGAAAATVAAARRDGLIPVFAAATGAAGGATNPAAPAAAGGDVCSVDRPGIGLHGDYFSLENCEGSILLARTDATINFTAGGSWPPALAAGRPRSVRWSGWIKAPLTGAFRFHLDAPNARLRLGRTYLIGDPSSPATAQADLTADRFFPVMLELRRLEPGTPPVRLEWTQPTGIRAVIPQALLHLPMAAVAQPVNLR